MLHNVIDQLESMSAQEQESLLNTQFPAEMQKEAEAAVDAMALAEACYALGGLKAERAVAEAEGLDKVASAEAIQEHDAMVSAIGEDIDALVSNLGLTENTDAVEFHKEAQAAAGIIFQGYVDTLDKLAADEKAEGGVRKFIGKASEGARGMGRHIMKHKGKYAGGAAGAAALVAGGAALHHHMKKKASELTGAELMELMDAREAAAADLAEIEAGAEKLATVGAAAAPGIAAKLRGHAAAAFEAAKKHKAAIGAGAGGMTTGYIAGLTAGHISSRLHGSKK